MNGVVMVSGATGFIGRSVCRYLASVGYSVRVLSRSRESEADFPGLVVLTERMTVKEMQAAMAGVTHFVHCAGLAHAERSYPASEFFAANAYLTRDLALAASREIPGKFIMVSSVSAVSGPFSDVVISSSTTPKPTNHYGRSKLSGEASVRTAFKQSNRFTILRPTLVYGNDAKGSLLRLFKLSAIPVPLPFAGLTAKRSMLELGSLVSAIDHVLHSDATNGKTYLVCDSSPIGLSDIVKSFRNGLGRPHRLFSVPLGLLKWAFVLSGRSSEWMRLSQPLVVDNSELVASGWSPVSDTKKRMRKLARAMATESRLRIRDRPAQDDSIVSRQPL